MKMKYFFTKFGAIFLIGSASAQMPPMIDFERDVIKSEQNAASAKLTVFNAAPTGNYDLKYVRCEWDISPDTLFISGAITSYFTVLENTELIYFDASDSLIIDSVIYHNSNLVFQHLNNEIEIELPEILNIGAFDSICVYYHGTPVSSGFGSFEITPHETGNTIWTLSEPYGASDWWPCKQTITDKIDSVDILVTTPSAYKSGGPGLLINEIVDGDFTTYHWRTKYPIATYLIGIAVSNYEVYSFYAPHLEDSVLFYNLIYPETFETAVPGIDVIVPSFELFSDIYSDYPYPDEKYGHMQFGWGGGMEHQTMSSVSNFNYELLVHEMAHQWFGDKITCGTWRDIWLNEGFATYSTWLSFDFSDDPNHYYEAWLSGTRNTIVSKPGGSVWVDDTTTTTRIFDGRLTYYKGAWILHMLRWELGETIFFEAIKNYITDPELIYNFAVTNDLKKHLETAGDTLLTEYFNDWFYGQGFPTYHLLWNQDENDLLTIALDQTTSDPSVDFFEMKVPVRLYGENDSLDVVLKHEKIGQLFQINVPFVVTGMIFDPEIKLLHANDIITHAELPEGTLQLVTYPNPADAELNIQMFSTVLTEYTATLYNNASQIVYSDTYRLDGSRGLIKIDISEFTPGPYILSVRDDENDIVQKIIIK